MYLTFFGFREKPFNLTPDPKFLYLNASYREALAALRYGINERKGFVSLVGEAGTGKTTLLRRLLAELGSDIRSVLILNPAVDFDELLVFILTDLGHAPPPGTPKLQLLQALNAELLDTLARGGNVVVLIDEAQDLSIPVLEELRLLSNLETAKEKILQFVLAGQPELDGMLARPELRQLRQRIAVPARLRPLGKGEVAAYVAARISAAGGDARGIFAPSALRQLYQFSRGVPRLVNVACDSALVTAYAAGTRLVDGKIMREAIRDLRRGPYRVSAFARWRTRIATVAVAGVVGAAMGLGASRLANGPLMHRRAGETSVPAGGATPQELPRQLSSGGAAPDGAEPQAVQPAGSEQAGTRATDVPQGAEAVPTPALATAALAAAVGATPAPPEAPGAVPEGAERRVYVQAGDDLTHIARRNYGYVTQELLIEIQRANPGLTNLDLLNAGQTIVLPPAPEPAPMPQAGAPAAAEPERAAAPR
jgi:general secretion pathway protein A